MPDPRPTADRPPAQRKADHASLARLAESLVPALVQKLASSGLGELEVQEGDWRIRLRRAPASPAPATRRSSERPRLGGHLDRDGRARDAVGGTAPTPGAAAAAAARAGFPAGASPSPDGHEPRRSVVTSPAVGVFRPEATPGRAVRAGDRIGTVDLLGIPQDVIAPIDGRLVEVFAPAGEAVEYGEEVAAIEAEAVDATVDPAPPAPGAPSAGETTA
jgi:acetyl-CoA carboxylase biotin carboxyl carrier protein